MRQPIDRRSFLQRATAATAFLRGFPLAAGSAPQALGRAGKPKKVVVIGAGLAGLTAAFELREAGHTVTIIEARTSPGGRVRTIRSPFPDGLIAEAGAGRIPENHEWTRKYIKHFGLDVAPFYPSELNFVTHIRGRNFLNRAGGAPDLADVPLDLTAEERALGFHGLVEKLFGETLELANRRSSWPATGLRRLDSMTLAEFARSRGVSPGVANLLGLAPGEYWPALEIIMIVANGHGARRLEKIVGGNDLLPRAFANQLADHIHYGAPVTRVEQDRNRVRAVYERHGKKLSIEADRLICTIPFTLVRRLEFFPRLSTAKHKAVQTMSYASLSRITFQVDDRYWLEKGTNGFGIIDDTGEMWHPTFDRPGRRGLLQIYLLGSSSETASRLTEPERIRYAIAQTERVFSGLAEHVEGAVSQCWDNDPWSRGAVRALAPGTFFDLIPHCATPEGRIHFAGDHTSSWSSYMNGAIESGHRAASEVNDA